MLICSLLNQLSSSPKEILCLFYSHLLTRKFSFNLIKSNTTRPFHVPCLLFCFMLGLWKISCFLLSWPQCRDCFQKGLPTWTLKMKTSTHHSTEQPTVGTWMWSESWLHMGQMSTRWPWMAGHPCTVPVSGIMPEWLLSYCSMMQISMPKRKASWPPYTLPLGTETAKTPWSSSWWTATSSQVWRTAWRKRHLTLPGGPVSITTSLKLWKAAQIVHLGLNNGSNNFLKFLSPSACFVWDMKYPHCAKLTSEVLREYFSGTQNTIPPSEWPDLDVKTYLKVVWIYL